MAKKNKGKKGGKGKKGAKGGKKGKKEKKSKTSSAAPAPTSILAASPKLSAAQTPLPPPVPCRHPACAYTDSPADEEPCYKTWDSLLEPCPATAFDAGPVETAPPYDAVQPVPPSAPSAPPAPPAPSAPSTQHVQSTPQSHRRHSVSSDLRRMVSGLVDEVIPEDEIAIEEYDDEDDYLDVCGERQEDEPFELHPADELTGEVDESGKPKVRVKVHVSPPAVLPRKEILYHVNVLGEDGVLEVDCLTPSHPLPNCRLREMEFQKVFDDLFAGGFVEGSSSGIFFENAPEVEEEEEEEPELNFLEIPI